MPRRRRTGLRLRAVAGGMVVVDPMTAHGQVRFFRAREE